MIYRNNRNIKRCTEKSKEQGKNYLLFDHVMDSVLNEQSVMLDCDVDGDVIHHVANFHVLDLYTFDLDDDLKTNRSQSMNIKLW